MLLRALRAVAVLVALSPAASAQAVAANAAGEYLKHLAALEKLSVAVAEAMPAGQYGYRPHPESMNFGALMSHIASTNYQFCAGLKDRNPPSLPSPGEKPEIVGFLKNSFSYCSAVISGLTGDELNALHNSPDGRLSGREVLLAMYIHVAHHRGQAEIYLRNQGIRPPGYMI